MSTKTTTQYKVSYHRNDNKGTILYTTVTSKNPDKARYKFHSKFVDCTVLTVIPTDKK